MERRHAYHKVPDSEGGTAQQPSSKWQIIWRVLNAIMVIFFILSAYVQHNDPDPYIWIPVYAIPAILSLTVCIYPQVIDNAIWKTVCLGHLALCLGGSVYLLAVTIQLLTAKGISNPLVHEEGRELAGLIIVVIWLAISRFSKLGNPANTWSSGKSLLLFVCILGLSPLAFWGMCFLERTKHLGHCTDMISPKNIEL